MSYSQRSLVDIRRDLHAHPEVGWTEFRTTALAAEALDSWGFTLHLGADALARDARLGVPPGDDINAAVTRARSEDAPGEYLDAMDGVTGLVAVKGFGDGPVVGVRVDMDALERTEASDPDHRPAHDGFASVHPGEMHACGHDGHTAIGLGIAREITGAEFDGTLKLFFQPAEEGGRGGLPMSKTRHLRDVDYFLALHLGLGLETGTVVAGFERPLSNAKLDVRFEGEPAHAGNAPQSGRNALHAATTAIQNLYGIPRNAAGTTRINVGQVSSPNPQNIIAEAASLRVEVRGATADLNEYMLERANRILTAAADMHGVDVRASLYGKTTSFTADDELVDRVADAAAGISGVDEVIDRRDLDVSEDASYLIERVQRQGGVATYVGIGASNVAGHHTATFDFDETALDIGVDVMTATIQAL